MFKKIKEKIDNNLYIKKYKELRANPKTKGLISLGMWILFMILAIVFIRISIPSNEVPKEVQKRNFDNMENYEFSFKDNNTSIYGESFDGKDIVYFNNNKYYYNGNLYLVSEDKLIKQDFSIDQLKITPDFINDLISNITPTESDGGKLYLVPLSRFINLFEVDTDVDLTSAGSYNIKVLTFSKSNGVYMIKIDLGNYYLFKGYPDGGVITINYYNIGKLSNFTLDYEDMLGGSV